jgi:hypothetical protein
MRITEVVEKQGKEGKPYWNIVIEGGESKYANWFDIPAPVVGMTDFEMVKGKAYTDKKGVQRNYWNAKPDKFKALVKRVEAIEKYLNSNNGQSMGSTQQQSSPAPDDMRGDPMNEQMPWEDR